MARKPSNNSTHANLGFEAQLWAAADALRNNMVAGYWLGDRQPGGIWI